MAEYLLAVALLIVFYTFAGYGVVLALLVGAKRLVCKKRQTPDNPTQWPQVCLFVTAYNEADCVAAKIENSLQLDYPADRLTLLWVTDGSDDGTPAILRRFPRIQVEHMPERRGKIHAMNRGMQFVKAEIVVFTDANTLLEPSCLKKIARHFSDPEVGCVAGEKRVMKPETGTAAATGENMYWSFESQLKRLESELSSVTGAAGELFALRSVAYRSLPDDCLLDDFQLSMRLALRGYRVVYEAGAIAREQGSATVSDELKRKSRIAAGGIQAMIQLPALLNPARAGWLSFQYFSHKVLRWTLAPLSLPVIFAANLALLLRPANSSELIHILLFAAQTAWYLLALLGWLTERTKLENKLFYIPYYFTAINLAAVKGLILFFAGRQPVTWEKARRA